MFPERSSAEVDAASARPGPCAPLVVVELSRASK
jgi:hypothetical protein